MEEGEELEDVEEDEGEHEGESGGAWCRQLIECRGF